MGTRMHHSMHYFQQSNNWTVYFINKIIEILVLEK